MSEQAAVRDVIGELFSDTEQSVREVEQRAGKKFDLNAAIDEMQQDLEKATKPQIEEAAKIRDQRMKDTHIRILTSRLDELREMGQQDEKSLAKALVALRALYQVIGENFDQLGDLTPEEQAGISRAEQELADAQQALAVAGQKFFFRKRGVAEAEARIATAERVLSAAKVQAQEKARDRLMNANMEVSLQQYQLMVDRIVQIMKDRLKIINGQVQAVMVRKQAAFTDKAEAARTLEKFDKQLNAREAELKQAEELVATLENGTEAHSKQTEKVSLLKAEVEDIRGKRNAALVLYQSKEKFADHLEVHQIAQMRLRDNHR
ncbi:MAG: hypothetical protein HY460_01545, partial [Parcubacteria group bacterium]|nr:hypothetical protein [Parcubacteria group bacterium]